MSKQVITVVDAPKVSLAENEKAGEALLKFYQKLGWNSEDMLDPNRVRIAKDVYEHLYNVMYEKCADSVGIRMLLVNRGPSIDEHVLPGKVHLIERWTIPNNNKRGDF